MASLTLKLRSWLALSMAMGANSFSFAADTITDCSKAQTAQYTEETGTLCLPVVEIINGKGSTFYKAQLQRSAAKFSLVSLEPVTSSGSNNPTFTVATGILKIPGINYYTNNNLYYDQYSAALKIDAGSHPATFQVSAAGDYLKPNQYTLSGNNINISYSTSGIDGKPHFSYHDLDKKLSFSGNQISTQETELGTVVSVLIVMTVDTGSTSFSILLPRIGLKTVGESLAIETLGITTDHKFSVIPQFEQHDFYTVTPLTGTAGQVFF